VNKVAIPIPKELLAKALKLPDEWEVDGVEWKFSNDTMLLYVRGEGFPAVLSNNTECIRISLLVTRNEEGDISVDWENYAV